MSRPVLVIEPLGPYFLKAAVNGTQKVTVYVTDSAGVPIDRGQVILGDADACDRFSDKHVPADGRELARAAFVRLSSKADAVRAEKNVEEKTPDAGEPAIDAAQAYEAAEPLATLQDIPAFAVKTLHALGVAGETRALKILYLAVVSRLVRAPLRPRARALATKPRSS